MLVSAHLCESFHCRFRFCRHFRRRFRSGADCRRRLLPVLVASSVAHAFEPPDFGRTVFVIDPHGGRRVLGFKCGAVVEVRVAGVGRRVGVGSGASPALLPLRDDRS